MGSSMHTWQTPDNIRPLTLILSVAVNHNAASAIEGDADPDQKQGFGIHGFFQCHLWDRSGMSGNTSDLSVLSTGHRQADSVVSHEAACGYLVMSWPHRGKSFAMP